MKGSSVLILIGILILFVGLGMPSTQTDTINGCVEGERGIPGDGYCSGVQSTTEVTTENPSKGPTIGFGILLIFIGGTISYSSGTTGKTSENKADTVIRVSSKVRKLETGEITKVTLPIYTNNVESAIKHFESRCEEEGYKIKNEPEVNVEQNN